MRKIILKYLLAFILPIIASHYTLTMEEPDQKQKTPEKEKVPPVKNIVKKMDAQAKKYRETSNPRYFMQAVWSANLAHNVERAIRREQRKQSKSKKKKQDTEKKLIEAGQ